MSWTSPIDAHRHWAPSMVPDQNTPAGFGFVRKHHIHEGVDLHCPVGTTVFPVEPGEVKLVCQFTGRSVGSPWWNRTECVMVEGKSGLVVYGELDASRYLYQGLHIGINEPLGKVMHVLPAVKVPRPSMLHLELRKPGHTELFDWKLGTEKPDWLLDPTPYLKEAR